ncbi:TetR family transcriptional regulator [Microtetraspora sp. NBRC 13810]|uniref:TetR/AcrR family transcriptional regulator n=1 Tax=Microtetraspora sp. NBRC 13810 TaxID=3030990 RepID=UPI0025522AF3|nr:TetR family transcriptional regulator [Microtetraspora sp. NBRC 13810]GLW09070.1 TetR family transcriptional regulator [Microtetraspora sp. NBRC 13810]
MSAGETETGRRRPGRRPGAADTRGQILAAARKIFAEKGFDKATIRGIAREAAVDPALVHHYFDSKDGVFVAAMRLPMDPSVAIPRLIAEGPREEVGRRLARFILTITADPQAREPVLGLVRTAMTNEQAVGMIREFITKAILGRVVESLGVPPLRMEVAFAQLFGVVAMRHVVRLEPLATADIEEIVDIVGPTLQRYIDGP